MPREVIASKGYLQVILAAVALLALQALALHLMGHPSVSTTHSFMLWVGDVHSRENSQQLADWYSFSHIIHGFLFYLGLWLLFPTLPVWQRFIVAVACETGWEIVENTPMVIHHYRQQALAQGYVGDSILNSLSDTCAMMLGFLIASRIPVWATVTAGLGLEAFTVYSIHDGLTLNVLGFFWTPEFIAKWQSR
jgi:hypothetical protein